MSDKRKCLCCEKEYDYCPNCGKSSTPWKVNYDTEACKELFNAVSAYNMKRVKEDYIKDILDKYSITDFSIYKKDIKKLLSNLFGNKSKIVEVNDTIVEETPVVEEVQVEQPKEVEVENSETFETTEATTEQSITPRRRRNRFFE